MRVSVASRSWRAGLLPVLLLLMPMLLASQVRVVGVKVLADEEFRSQRDWKGRVTRLMEGVSKEFEELFQIRFNLIGTGPWESQDGVTTLERLAEKLSANLVKGDADIIVAFTAQKGLLQSFSGYSLFREGVVLLEHNGERKALVRTLTHELSHLFGAVHVANPDSVMDYFVRGGRFDSLNMELIRLNRDRLFNSVDFPLRPDHFPAIIEICQRVILANHLSREDRSQKNYVQPGIKGLVNGKGERDYAGLEDVHLLIAEIHLECRRYPEARREAEKALEIVPDSLDAQNIRAIALRNEREYDRAIEEYRELLRRKPDHPQILYNLGIAYAWKGDPASAQACYQKALDLKPNFAQAWNNMGENHLIAGDVERATDAFRKAIGLNPRYGLARANLAEAYFRNNLLDLAEAEVESALALKPGLASAHNLLGNIHQVRNDMDRAVEEYRLAIELNPLSARPYFNLGRCSAKTGNLSDAKEYYLTALEKDPDFAEARANLGYCYLLESHLHLAISEIGKAHELGFSNARTYLNLSFAYHRRGLLGLALDAARMSYDMDPELAQTHAHLVVLYLKLEDLESARWHADIAQSKGLKLKAEILEKIKE
jgi:tetratricopeptide (TPR) repeat protein